MRAVFVEFLLFAAVLGVLAFYGSSISGDALFDDVRAFVARG
jgi:hypothetical protein